MIDEETALRSGTTEFPILETLRAEGPHPSHRDKLKVFGQFVGVWDLDVLFYDENGKIVYRQPGEWSFANILDGRAIQDVLVSQSRRWPSELSRSASNWNHPPFLRLETGYLADDLAGGSFRYNNCKDRETGWRRNLD